MPESSFFPLSVLRLVSLFSVPLLALPPPPLTVTGCMTQSREETLPVSCTSYLISPLSSPRGGIFISLMRAIGTEASEVTGDLADSPACLLPLSVSSPSSLRVWMRGSTRPAHPKTQELAFTVLLKNHKTRRKKMTPLRQAVHLSLQL